MTKEVENIQVDSVPELMGLAVAIAVREATLRGDITDEIAKRILKRADSILQEATDKGKVTIRMPEQAFEGDTRTLQ